MEKIASDLKASETKQRSLGKTYESLHSQASSMLVLSIQWKDLQEHFDSTRNAIRTCFEELREREKMLEAKELKFKSEMESKTDELCGVQKLVDEKVQEVIELKRSIQKHSQEIEREEKRVMDVQKLVVDKERECGVVERRIQERTKKLNWVERRIEEKLNEVESKEKELNKYREDIKVKMEQLGVIDETIVEGKEKIESKEEEIKAAQMLLEECERRIKSKEEKLSWIEKSIEDTSKLANLKEEEVRVIQGSLNVYRESIKSKEGELDAILESIEGKKREFDVKEEQIKTLQRLIEGCEKELKSKEEKLKEETLKVKEYSLRNRPMEEWSCKLELKEREVELKEKQVESKMEEFKKWVEERGKELNSLSSELKVKEGQLQQEAKDLELAKKQCGVVAQVNNAIVPSSASDQSNINFTDGRNLQQFMYEHMKRNDSMSNKISSILQQESSEPGKLVLDAMQGFYPSNTTVENNEFDLVLIRRTCILLLEELKRASPQINPELIEEAMKLASDWKAKMKVGSENWLEILGFLRLVTTYELTSAYDRKELQSLFHVVAQHEQAMELFRALGTTYKAPDYGKICSSVKTEKPESQVAKNEATSSNLQVTATTTDATHLQGLQNEQFRGIIYDLIKKKRLMDAAGLIYTLKLFDEFPPVQVLKEYVDKGNKCCRNRTKRKKLLDEKDKITDQHIADLRVVIQCIKAYNLESEYPPEEIESQIALLERSKKQRRVASSSLVLEVEQQQQTSLKIVEFQEQQELQKTSNAKLQQKADQKASKVEQQEQQQEQKTSKGKLQEKVEQKASDKVESQQQVQEKIASKIEQLLREQKTLKARLQEKVEQKACNKVEKRKQLQEQKASEYEQQEQQKTSKAKLEEKVEQKASDKVEEQQQKQEQNTSKATLQEKVEQKASNQVEEQQQQQEHQNASKVKPQEQPKQKKGNKRSHITFATRFDHQQQLQNKSQRTSVVANRPIRLHQDHPDYPNSSSSTWPHERYGYHGQFGTPFNNYHVHANYGHPVQFGIPISRRANYGYGGHNPGLNQSYPYLPRHPPR
ncbi:PREDICTED: myosin-2 heavy chain-like [Fragaria vesca subsp. vesca]|uniref:myosin-2 heavy chain-like n=1 Tax=Fragaria vesca subsp. vesca TaxID=101020 RepID=UPI0002C3152F|nr:PREDICTED: myosin-2 heavy chain-like [Fragaria vesca subsp. vesca]